MAKISKAKKKRLLVFGTCSLFIIGYFMFSLIYNIYEVQKLKEKEKELNIELKELKRQAKILNAEIDKLKDPEYIAAYARENFSYSKNGEYIIKLNNEQEKKEETDNDINIDYNYIIYGGILFFLILFIYIIKKNK